MDPQRVEGFHGGINGHAHHDFEGVDGKKEKEADRCAHGIRVVSV